MKKNMVLVVFICVLIISGCMPSPTQQMDLYGTAIVAQQQVQMSGMALTGTAEAPIIHITETQAAWNLAQQQANATSEAGITTATAAMALTQASWSPTPLPTSTPNATATVAAHQFAVQIEKDNFELERARWTNGIKAASLYVIGFVILVAALIWSIGLAKKNSVFVIPMNEQGDKHPIMVDGIVIDPDRMPNGMGQASQSYIKSLPAITADRQNIVTSRDQLIDLKARTKVTTAAMERLLQSQGVKLLPEGQQQNDMPLLNDAFPLPAWEIIDGWNGEKNQLPYGITARGLDFVNIDEIPHIAVLSMTGMGKSRRFIRPFVACALAAGHRVVIVGKSTDYWIFEDHPNAMLVKVSQITESKHAERYANILQGVVQEMNKRDDYLTQHRKSTWSHAGRERTFIVLDELGNALRLMPSNLSDQSRIWVEGLVSEGRKVGFNVVLANQRATGMAAILSQTGKAIFRVEKDEEKGHRSLVGAGDLSDGYFFAKFGANKLAGSFEPSDEQILAFLRNRPVPPLENDWVDGQFSVVNEQVAGPSDAELRLAESRKLAAEEARILELHRAGESNTAIVYAVWPKSGSGFKEHMERVRAVIATTSTTSSQKSSDLGIVAG
jgi:hypothetical protein